MRYVLFVRTHKAGRSQMAQAFFEKYGQVICGPSPPGRLRRMQSGPTWSRRCAKSGSTSPTASRRKIELEMQPHADKAITLNCQGSCPYVIGGIEDWDVDDPAG
jgi:arsenate reductase (thioredoxin)